jgi:signal transduction histidine kinase
MSMIGIDAEETAQALDDRAEFAAAELMRELDSQLTQKGAEVARLRQVIAHLMTNPLNQSEATYWTSDITGQTGRVEITHGPNGQTTIRIIDTDEK